MDERTKEICLLLIYYTGWEEESNKFPGKKIHKTWRGYPYSLLSQLEDEELIVQHWNVQSLILTDAGKEKVIQLKEKYKILH